MVAKLWRNVQNAIDEAYLRYTIEHPEATESERNRIMEKLIAAGKEHQKKVLNEIMESVRPAFTGTQEF